jgi:hypothetical protein
MDYKFKICVMLANGNQKSVRTLILEFNRTELRTICIPIGFLIHRSKTRHNLFTYGPNFLKYQNIFEKSISDTTFFTWKGLEFEEKRIRKCHKIRKCPNKHNPLLSL